MKLQLCHCPLAWVDYGTDFYRSPRALVQLASELGASYINLWVLWTSLYHRDPDFSHHAWLYYHEFLEWCGRYQIGVIGKLPSRLPEAYGQPYPATPDYVQFLKRYHELISDTDEELHFTGYMVGNEPRQELVPPGVKVVPIFSPHFNPHTIENQARILTDLIAVVSESVRALVMTPAHMSIGWPGVLDLIDAYVPHISVDYLAVNAYPLKQYRKPVPMTKENYSDHYSRLLRYGFDIWPSEQGIHPTWRMPANTYATMMELTETFSARFSHFILQSHTVELDPWALIRKDGSRNEQWIDLLKSRFYQPINYYRV